MNKDQIAHEYMLEMLKNTHANHGFLNSDEIGNLTETAWAIADAMQAEADKRALQKRAELRELLNHPNTFIEKEGMHFDDVEFEVDWDLAPENAVAWEMRESGCFKWFCNVDGGLDFEDAPSFGYTGDWRNSLRKRPEMEAERHALRGECE